MSNYSARITQENHLSQEFVIEERVIQRAMADYPEINQLVEFSTPVVSFGYPRNSRVATLGINPSSNEFQIGMGNTQPLAHEKKRLVDTEVLGLDKPKSLTREQAIQVIEGCYRYFETNPYSWFSKLEEIILQPSGFSYYGVENKACHLDLVQWATDPVWQSIKDRNVTRQLLQDDREFLEYQLTEYDFEYIFLNGSTVIETVSKLGIVDFEKVGEVDFNATGTKSFIVKGKFQDKIFLGWGINAGYNAAYKPGLTQLS